MEGECKGGGRGREPEELGLVSVCVCVFEAAPVTEAAGPGPNETGGKAHPPKAKGLRTTRVGVRGPVMSW